MIALLQKQDAAAFAFVYNAYWPKLYLYAYKILKDGIEAEDVVQEVLMSLWKKAADLAIKTDVLSYLLGAVKFACFNHIDKSKVRQEYLDSLYEFANSEVNQSLELVYLKDLTRILEESVAKLPEKMREVFALSRYQQLSQKEIAEKLGISEKTVKKQINKALKSIKRDLRVLILSFVC